MTQYLDAARAMNEAFRLPVVFDADTGYGNEHNVAYATKRIEEDGLAALFIKERYSQTNEPTSRSTARAAAH